MALDTSGVYSAGDDIRVIEVLRLPFGSFVLDCVQDSMNQLETMSSAAATNLVAELTAFEAAEAAETTQNLSDSEGKTLVEADVLKWEKDADGVPSGNQKEMQRASSQIERYLSFSPCLSSYLAAGNVNMTNLVRS